LNLKKYNLKIAKPNEINLLSGLSTESLIIWIVGKCEQKNVILNIEEITLECWIINPKKHSLRGYAQYPDSFVIMKRIFDMKGRKGLIQGTVQGGFHLTEISKKRFADINANIEHGFIPLLKSKNAADRTISSIEEAPYRRLIKSPVYQKYCTSKLDEIVETDFLYFYGINWHSKSTIIENKIKNVDAVVKKFADKDPILVKIHDLLNEQFKYVKIKLLDKKK
jgi:hypothetical protein